MTLFSLYQLTTSCTWQRKTPAPVSFTVTLHFPLAYVFVSLRRLQRTMAFAGMLSDEDIRAAVQACQSESDNTHTHTHTLTHWWDAAKFTPALCFNIIFRYPVLYVSNSIFCNFLLRLHLTNKILPPAWIYFRSWATWETWSINTNHILQIYKSPNNDGAITDQSHLMGSDFSS